MKAQQGYIVTNSFRYSWLKRLTFLLTLPLFPLPQYTGVPLHWLSTSYIHHSSHLWSKTHIHQLRLPCLLPKSCFVLLRVKENCLGHGHQRSQRQGKDWGRRNWGEKICLLSKQEKTITVLLLLLNLWIMTWTAQESIYTARSEAFFIFSILLLSEANFVSFTNVIFFLNCFLKHHDSHLGFRG